MLELIVGSQGNRLSPAWHGHLFFPLALMLDIGPRRLGGGWSQNPRAQLTVRTPACTQGKQSNCVIRGTQEWRQNDGDRTLRLGLFVEERETEREEEQEEPQNRTTTAVSLALCCR